MLYVSVIVPTFNAAATIRQTLDSLLVQTSPAWEAIVVDDGSKDDTAVIVTRLAEDDDRIRLISQPNGGVSAARNAGIREARYDWLLFLDADDWILSTYLERMTAVLVAQPDLDAIHCGSARVTPDGQWLEAEYVTVAPDMFPTFARMSAFPIHACIVRRSLVKEVGGFEVGMTMCEDWDLWQRIARTGAQFGSVKDVLALYRVRPHSASTDGMAMFQAALDVLRRGHGPDPRVLNPAPEHADGLPTTYLARRSFYQAAWFAGIVIGSGGDARPLLANLEREHEPSLEADTIAQFLFKSSLFPKGHTPTDWTIFWPEVADSLDAFLNALEQQAGIAGLAQNVPRHIERLIIAEAAEERPFTFNQTHAIQLELTHSIPEITLPSGVTQLLCDLTLEGKALGQIAVVHDEPLVTADTIADAVAAEKAWDILEGFFVDNLYPHLRVARGSERVSLWRGDLHLGSWPVAEETLFWAGFHKQVGWHLFLQEVWDRPAWPKEYFYHDQIIEGATLWRHESDSPFTVELGVPLPDVVTEAEELEARLEVGGKMISVVALPVIGGMISSHQLRVALTTAAGYDLCVAAVRAALIGRPLHDGRSLQERLVSSISERRTLL